MSCLESLMYPLLTSLLESGSASQSESYGVNSTALGKDKTSGKAVMMLVHYSRDTAEKQWDETRVYALQGSGRVMKGFIEIWSNLSQFVALWPIYLQVIERGVSNRSTEVALAAISAIQEVLLASTSQQALLEQSSTLFAPILPMYKQIVGYSCLQAQHLTAMEASDNEDQIMVSSSLVGIDTENGWKHWMKTYTQLVTSFQNLLTNARKLFNDSDVEVILNLLQQLTRVNTTYVDTKAAKKGGGGDEGKETPLQAATLKLIDSLHPLPEPLWPIILSHLLSYLTSNLSSSSLQPSSSLSPPPMLTAASPLPFSSAAFARRTLRVLDRLFCHLAPISVRLLEFERVLFALTSVMNSASTMLRTGGGGDLCEEAVGAWIHVMEAGLTAVEERGEAKEGLWKLMMQSFESFLAPPATPTSQSFSNATSASSLPLFSLSRPVLLPVRSSIAEQKTWEHLQIAMVSCLVRVVLPHSSQASTEMQWKMISLLNIGYTTEELGIGNGVTQAATMQQVRGAASPPASPRGRTGGENGHSQNGSGGLSMATANYELLSHACMMALFTLTSRSTSTSTSSSKVACLSIPLLLSRCESILSSYLIDERASGEFPLPRCRREEVAFVLRELSQLQVDENVARITFETDKQKFMKDTFGESRNVNGDANASRNGIGSDSSSSSGSAPSVYNAAGTGILSPLCRSSNRSHLLRLFPLLCDCIAIRDGELRELLRQVMQIAANEIGLAYQQATTATATTTTAAPTASLSSSNFAPASSVTSPPSLTVSTSSNDLGRAVSPPPIVAAIGNPGDTVSLLNPLSPHSTPGKPLPVVDLAALSNL